MVKCNKYYAADDMPLLSHDHLSRLHWHNASCSLTANQHASEAVMCCDTNAEWKPKSNLYHQVLVNVVPPHQNWLSSKEVAAAAALLGSSGCTLQQRRQDSPRAPILRVMKHKRQSGAMRSPALATSSTPDKESSLQLFLPASYSSPPLHGHWTNPELLEATLHITCYAALLNAA